MNLNEFTEQMEILTLAFPQAFPRDDKIRAATAAVWFKSFSHLQSEVFGKAVQHCIDHERFLSIAGIWDALMNVARIPNAVEIREEINDFSTSREQSSSLPGEEELHPITRRILGSMGGTWHINRMSLERFEILFNRDYKDATLWWQEHLRKPKNVDLLTAFVSHSGELSAAEVYERLREDASPGRLLKA